PQRADDAFGPILFAHARTALIYREAAERMTGRMTGNLGRWSGKARTIVRKTAVRTIMGRSLKKMGQPNADVYATEVSSKKRRKLGERRLEKKKARRT